MMEATESTTKRKRILLSGVFGPYGVDDEYGRKENIMELFHNQVTKAQGNASFRFFHRSFGLYFLAANVDADVTVLDFPSKKRFNQEIKKGYDIVGISFIAPNFLKAKEMAKLTRTDAPNSTILLGGHGAAIEGVEEAIECDHVVKGEGIRWLREFLGQNPDAPIEHPALPSTEKQSILGVPIPGPTASLLVPGVGCVNGCKFCCTSHFFGKNYTSYLGTGKELFDTARRIADERGTDAFFVMDENFLKDKQRAMELMDEMEKHNRYFRFHLFSSAEAIAAFGYDNLVRLGVTMLWIGFESQFKDGFFPKNVGLDAKQMVWELRDRGISVLGSGILCMEHHTPENMQADIDFLIGLEADFVQFMLYTPMPVTALYEEHKKRGVLREDIPYEEWHGQKKLIYRHPHFKAREPEKWLNQAFREEFEKNASSIHRVIETTHRGYKRLAAMENKDACLKIRESQFEDQLREYSAILPVIKRAATSRAEKEKAIDLDARVAGVLGQPTFKESLLRNAACAVYEVFRLRTRLFGDRIQPQTIVTGPKAIRVSQPVLESLEIPKPVPALDI